MLMFALNSSRETSGLSENKTNCLFSDIFALGLRVKFTQNNLVLKGVDVWTSKTFAKAEENINLPFLRSLNGILLLDVKQSLIFFAYLTLRGCSTFAKFAYFGVSAKPCLGESGHSSISRKLKFAEPFENSSIKGFFS